MTNNKYLLILVDKDFRIIEPTKIWHIEIIKPSLLKKNPFKSTIIVTGNGKKK